MDFSPNILDSYNLSTYNITWYMLPPELVSSTNRQTDWKPSNGIIVAQSGVTSQIFIDELTFTSHPNFTEAARNATYTTYNMTLRELSGASLIDKIIAASIELGIENYYQTPYFVQIEFKGNQSPNGSDPVVVPNLTYRWPIMIGGIQTSVDAGGSSYNVEGFHFDELSQQDVYGSVDKMWSITASTIGGALNQLQTALVSRSLSKSLTSLSKADDYEIIVDPEIAAFQLTSEQRDKLNRSASMAFEEVDRNEVTTVSSEKNIPIVELINRIVQASPKYQMMAQQSDAPGKPETNDPNAIKELHRIVSKCDQLEYDVTRGVYQRKYTYYVQPYKVGQLIATKEDLKATSTGRYRNYVNNRFIDKRYFYLFTGQNDQILEFDMTFNYAWFVNMPPQSGIGNQGGTSTDGGKGFQKDKDPEIKKREEDNQKAKHESSANKSPAAARAEAAKAQEATPPTAEDREIVNRLQEQSKAGRLPANERVSFVEDIDLEAGFKAGKYRKYPIAFLETSAEETKGADAKKSVDESNSSGNEYVNSLFNQAFTRPSGDLADIQLHVKGDPYWMGNSLESTADHSFPYLLEPSQSRYGSVGFVFTVRTPELPGTNTGTVRSRTTALNGLYLVKQVDHTFSNGMFTQTLRACIDPLIDINEVLND